MPLLRYFTYVGGVLLALLFVASPFIPEAAPVPERDAAKPVIRIASVKVGPPRVDFDTSVQGAPVPALVVAKSAALTPPRPPAREAMAQLAEPHAAAAVPPPAATVRHRRSPRARRSRVQACAAA